MIGAETEARILRLHHAERWPITTIAREVGVHHSTVRRVLAQAGIKTTRQRPSMIDPYMGWMLETLARYPRISAQRLWLMARERGYPGGADHFRSIVARHRPRPAAQAFLRLRSLPAEQAQVDWGHFGQVKVGRAVRKLSCFAMVLSYSRRPFIHFSYDQRMPSFLRGHRLAFEFFLRRRPQVALRQSQVRSPRTPRKLYSLSPLVA